jgi:antitoxin FitA
VLPLVAGYAFADPPHELTGLQAPALAGKREDDIIDIIRFLEKREMADLLVRGIDEELVRALKERAGAHGRSAEAEHREILAAALARPRRRSFAEALASMPEVGADADFERVSSTRQAPDVFD